jgi:putative molybdopterin biosynthesis protein
VAFVEREQGLFVKKGNPKGIQSLEDLVRDDVSFVNRQRGAGTRVLLDYQLNLLGIDPQDVNGYDHEEYTHLTVSAAVASDRADCGLGIPAAAQALDLDFIPLYHERYDLIIPQEFIQGSLLAPMIDILRFSKFQQAVRKLPGYGVSQMGEVIVEVG